MAKHILSNVEGFVRRSEFFQVDPRAIVVDHGWNGRTDFSGEDELMSSIISVGVRVPLTVRKEADDTLHLVDGERRLRAVLRAISEGHDIKSIPAMVCPRNMNEADRFIDSIVKNDGKPFTAIEEAGNYQRLMNWGYEVSEIAKRVGKSPQHIRNRLQLNGASPAVQDALAEGSVSITEATEISKDPSIDAQKEKVKKAKKPHAKKNLIIKYKEREVVYSGPGKDYYLESVEAAIFNDDVFVEIKRAGFDPDTMKISFAPLADA